MADQTNSHRPTWLPKSKKSKNQIKLSLLWEAHSPRIGWDDDQDTHYCAGARRASSLDKVDLLVGNPSQSTGWELPSSADLFGAFQDAPDDEPEANTGAMMHEEYDIPRTFAAGEEIRIVSLPLAPSDHKSQKKKTAPKGLFQRLSIQETRIAVKISHTWASEPSSASIHQSDNGGESDGEEEPLITDEMLQGMDDLHSEEELILEGLVSVPFYATEIPKAEAKSNRPARPARPSSSKRNWGLGLLKK
jgi:hypothetical protein